MIPWRRRWQPTPVFLQGKFHGQRSLGNTIHEVKRVRHNWATEHTHIIKMKVSSCNSKSLSSCIHFSLTQVVSTVTWTAWICFDLIKNSINIWVIWWYLEEKKFPIVEAIGNREHWTLIYFLMLIMGFPGGSVVKNLPGNSGDIGLIPGLGGSPGKENGNPLQYSCLGDPMDRGTWEATVRGLSKSQTQLSN